MSGVKAEDIARFKAAVEQVREMQGGVCLVVAKEAMSDPKIREAFKNIALDSASDALLSLVPGVGAFQATKDISQQGYYLLKQGDVKGAGDKYLSMLKVGLATVVPAGGHVAREMVHDSDPSVDISQPHKFVNIVNAAILMCRKSDAAARVALKPKADQDDLDYLANALISEGQLDGMTRILKMVAEARSNQKQQSAAELGTLPKPSPQTQSPKPRDSSHGHTY